MYVYDNEGIAGNETFKGWSTDKKPIEGVRAFSIFYELDTGKKYYLAPNKLWYEIKSKPRFAFTVEGNSSGNFNIQGENIVVDFGDGKTETATGDISHNYAKEGKYQISITGVISSFSALYNASIVSVDFPFLDDNNIADCDRMFQGCNRLVSVPYDLLKYVEYNSCSQMFYGCTSLVSAPELPATTLAAYCYSGMFQNCTSLKISETQDEEYIYAYRIPKEGTGVYANNALSYMFTNTGGTFTTTPSINTTYYTDHKPIG